MIVGFLNWFFSSKWQRQVLAQKKKKKKNDCYGNALQEKKYVGFERVLTRLFLKVQQLKVFSLSGALVMASESSTILRNICFYFQCTEISSTNYCLITTLPKIFGYICRIINKLPRERETTEAVHF